MNLRPNFFIIGAPRSGTTSMYRYLREHPEVAMADLKEPHYFCDDLIDPDFITDRDDYLALFQNVSNEPRIGEASVWYMYSNRASVQIWDFNPEARLIALLRNPLEMLPSIFWHHVYTGYEASEDFETTYRSRREAASRGELAAPFESFRQQLEYSRITRYWEQLERFYRTFPRGQIHIVLFEDLKADPARSFKEVAEFLGIDPGFEPEFTRFNPQRRVRNRDLARALLRWQGANSSAPPPRSEFGANVLRVRRRVVHDLSRLNSAPARPSAISSSFLDLIVTDHREDLARLGELIERDLTHWFD